MMAMRKTNRKFRRRNSNKNCASPQAEQKISRAAAQTTNCESLTGKSDSTSPTKTAQAQ
jgi:hypothetical protein